MQSINFKPIETNEIKIFEGTFPKEFQKFRNGYFVNVLPELVVQPEPSEDDIARYKEMHGEDVEYEAPEVYKFYSYFTTAPISELEDIKNEVLRLITKFKKEEALAGIKVTTSAGNTFDGDETARNSMISAILSSEIVGLNEHQWKLADNTVQAVSLDELREALALSIQAVGEILIG